MKASDQAEEPEEQRQAGRADGAGINQILSKGATRKH
jgi:hypothetical protein